MSVTKKTVNIGDNVYCDYCNADWTNKDESGGVYFTSYAICPDCTPRAVENIRKHKEEKYIRATCPEDMSFADWVRDVLRGGEPGTIEVKTFKTDK